MTEQEFKYYWDKYKYSLIGYAEKRLQDWQEAEDVVSEAFIELWKAKQNNGLKTFLFRVIHHKCLNIIKHKRIAKTKHEILIEQSPEYVEALDIKAELVERIRKDIAALPEKRRRIVQMYLDDLSPSEIATALGISINTVNVQYFRCVQWLRNKYPKYFSIAD